MRVMAPLLGVLLLAAACSDDTQTEPMLDHLRQFVAVHGSSKGLTMYNSFGLRTSAPHPPTTSPWRMAGRRRAMCVHIIPVFV